MLKIKYYTLKNDERKKIRKEFYNTEYGKNLKYRLDRLFIIGFIGILFSLYLFFSPSNKWDIVSGVILDIASLIFIIGSFKIRIQKINDYLVKKKK